MASCESANVLNSNNYKIFQQILSFTVFVSNKVSNGIIKIEVGGCVVGVEIDNEDSDETLEEFHESVK